MMDKSLVDRILDGGLPGVDVSSEVDRFVPSAEKFVSAVFGKGVLDAPGDLRQVVSQVSAMTPIALASSLGFDASYKVDSLVEQLGVNCTNVAMGSNEGLATADKAV